MRSRKHTTIAAFLVALACYLILLAVQDCSSLVIKQPGQQPVIKPHVKFNFDDYSNTSQVNLTAPISLAKTQDNLCNIDEPIHPDKLYADTILLTLRSSFTSSCNMLDQLANAKRIYPNIVGLILGDNNPYPLGYEASNPDQVIIYENDSSIHSEVPDLIACYVANSVYEYMYHAIQDDQQNKQNKPIIVTIDAQGLQNYYPYNRDTNIDPMIQKLSIFLPIIFSFIAIVIFWRQYSEWRIMMQSEPPVVAQAQQPAIQPHRQEQSQNQGFLASNIAGASQSNQASSSYQRSPPLRTLSQHDQASSSFMNMSNINPLPSDSVTVNFNQPTTTRDIDLESDISEDYFTEYWNDLTLWEKFNEQFLIFTSWLGKPSTIMLLNAIVYLIHFISAIVVLVLGWKEKCSSDYHSLISLFLCRSVVGCIITFYQTHAGSNFPPPSALVIFAKNWSDYCFLFGASTFNTTQDCRTNEPILFTAVEIWTIMTWITFGSRLVLFFTIKSPLCAIQMPNQDQQANPNDAANPDQANNNNNLFPHNVDTPAPAPAPAQVAADNSASSSSTSNHQLQHNFAYTFRNLLSNLLLVINGGFFCAGRLDHVQPASILDLRHIPLRKFHIGMFPPDDSICSVCYCEYEPGEILRILFCGHHYHISCIDTWLLQKSLCPVCRSGIDSKSAETIKKLRKLRKQKLKQQLEQIQKSNRYHQQQQAANNAASDQNNPLNQNSSHQYDQHPLLANQIMDSDQYDHDSHSVNNH